MSVPPAAISVLRAGLASSPPMSWAKLGAALGCCDVTAKRWARELGLNGGAPPPSRGPGDFWSRADVHDRLVQGWADPDQTAADVARAISEIVGHYVSGNAVIGRGHRAVLGPKAARRAARTGHIRGLRQPPPTEPALAERRKAAQAEVAARRASPPPPAVVVPPRPPAPVRTGPVRACCYPIGEPRTPGFRYCEDPSLPGRPMCPTHQAICYRPVSGGRLGMSHAA